MAALPKFFSPSASNTYQQCPLRWKFRYVDKLPDPPGVPALVGTFAHRVLELLCEEPAPQRTSARAKELARQVWPEISGHKDFQALDLNDEEQRDFRWRSWKAIEGLWDLENPSEVDVLSTEKRMRTELSGVPFMGIIDRLDQAQDGTVVTDYKSGKPPRVADRDHALEQILLYAAAVEAESGERPVRGQLLYLGKETLETEVTADRLADCTGQLASIWSSLNKDCAADTFAASPGPLCGWCPYAGRCEDGAKEIKRRLAAGRMRQDAPALKLI
ncbi:MAG: PD-(D/E)XK nuclease family protein [Actinobacteria bacterium]|nr:PD-(D/E)XK nuclease family protein [Actinomycetota bacterium]MBT6970021.1 PD-(D/E)XK nuclease family protein [Actinomycetota bacterium]